jgi:hypothetical protein
MRMKTNKQQDQHHEQQFDGKHLHTQSRTLILGEGGNRQKANQDQVIST